MASHMSVRFDGVWVHAPKVPLEVCLGRPLGLGFAVLAGAGVSTSGVDRPSGLEGESEGGGKFDGWLRVDTMLARDVWKQ